MTRPLDPERALVASLRWLTDESDLPTARRVLAAVDLDEDVSDPQVRSALDAARVVVERGNPPSPLLVRDELLSRGRVPGQRDPGDLLVDLASPAECIDYTPAPPLVRSVHQQAFRRRCWEAGKRIQQAAQGPQDGLLFTVRRETDAVAAMHARHLAARAELAGTRRPRSHRGES